MTLTQIAQRWLPPILLDGLRVLRNRLQTSLIALRTDGVSLHGYDSFKQMLARRYFAWVDAEELTLLDDLYRLAQDAPPPITFDARELLRQYGDYSPEQSRQFNLNTILFYAGLAHRMEILEEPLEGSPLYLMLDGKRISQDVMFSARDYQAISQCCDLEKAATIIELAGGYGRTAYYLLTKHPQVRYILVDVPPILDIAQRYLTSQFPNRDLQFLLPEQVASIKNHSVDIAFSIDSLGQIDNQYMRDYLDHLHRVAKKFFVTSRPELIRRLEIPKTWRIIYDEPALFPSCNVNRCYEIAHVL